MKRIILASNPSVPFDPTTYFFAPWGDYAGMISSSTVAATTAGVVRCIKFILPYKIIITQVTININATSNTGHEYLAIYDEDKNLIVQATFNLTAATGVYSTTIPSTVLNGPKPYYLAWSADNNVSVPLAAGTLSTNGVNIFNKTAVKVGTAANASSAGKMPSTLGAISSTVSLPVACLLEP
jgi:hypothetical protein